MKSINHLPMHLKGVCCTACYFAKHEKCKCKCHGHYHRMGIWKLEKTADNFKLVLANSEMK